MTRLANKVVVLTGAGSGIGLAAVKLFSQHGAKLLLAGRNEAALASAVKLAGEGKAAYVVADVSKPEDNERLIRMAEQKFGGVDAFIANAGVEGAAASIVDYPVDVFDQVMAINVRGPYLMVRHVAPHMMKRRSGKIINIASGAAYKGVPRMLPYVTSKGAILAFTRALSRELGQYGIAVNSLSPGYILSDTGLQNTQHVEDERIPVRNARAFKRDAYPEDLLGTLVFLASNDSDFITGQSIVVDGGAINN